MREGDARKAPLPLPASPVLLPHDAGYDDKEAAEEVRAGCRARPSCQPACLPVPPYVASLLQHLRSLAVLVRVLWLPAVHAC